MICSDQDNVTYKGANSGCAVATRYMCRPSECINCPFATCIYDQRLERPKGHKGLTKLQLQYHERMKKIALVPGTVSEVARQFHVSRDVVRRARIYGEKVPTT